MILIGGTELQIEEMPLSDMLDYIVENNPSILDIKIKTVAKSDNCLKVLVHTDLSITIPEEVSDKTSFFSSDDELLVLLGGINVTTDDSTEEGVVISSVVSEEFGTEELSSSVSDYVPSEAENVEIEEVKQDFESFMIIPNIGDDINNMKVTIETQQRIIDQKDDQLMEYKLKVEEIYKNQEIQLIEMRSAHEARVAEVNDVLEKMQQRVKNSEIPEESRAFLKYAVYSQNPKAALREGFSQEEVNRMGNLQSSFYVFAGGGGEGLKTMLGNVHSLIEDGTKAIIVDFSNDGFLSARLKNKAKENSLHLNKDDVDVQSLVKDHNKSKLIFSPVFNDIALLSMDWVKILKKLDLYACGRPVILLFNTISSFSVKYVVSRLSSICETFIFTNSNPHVLFTLNLELPFMPHKRYKIVAMNYIELVKPVLQQLGEQYQVQAFGDKVKWDILKIRV